MPGLRVEVPENAGAKHRELNAGTEMQESAGDKCREIRTGGEVPEQKQKTTTMSNDTRASTVGVSDDPGSRPPPVFKVFQMS